MTSMKPAVKARKAEMARITEESDVKGAEALAPAENAVGDGKINRSADAVAVSKPSGFDLNKFKSKRADAVAKVDTLQTGLPVSSMSQAKDFVRLHPDEEYWSPELCFVMVPIKGAKRDSLHLIEEDLAMQFLPSGKIMRFRLALATKPLDVFFLCRIPTRNRTTRGTGTALRGANRQRSCGLRPQVVAKKESMHTSSRSRATRMPSQNQNGRSNRSPTSSTGPSLDA